MTGLPVCSGGVLGDDSVLESARTDPDPRCLDTRFPYSRTFKRPTGWGWRPVECCGKALHKIPRGFREVPTPEKCAAVDSFYIYNRLRLGSQPDKMHEAHQRCIMPLSGTPDLKLEAEHRSEIRLLLNDELATRFWVDAQQHYINSLDETTKDYLKMYMEDEPDIYPILNAYLRNGRVLNETIMSDIDDLTPFICDILQRFRYVEDWLDDFAGKIDAAISGAPKTDKRMVLYRGQDSLSNLARGRKGKLYVSTGILSASIKADTAFNFGIYHLRIVVPEGTSCLLLSHIAKHEEYEVVFPDRTLYYVLAEPTPIVRRFFDGDSGSIKELEINYTTIEFLQKRAPADIRIKHRVSDLCGGATQRFDVREFAGAWLKRARDRIARSRRGRSAVAK